MVLRDWRLWKRSSGAAFLGLSRIEVTAMACALMFLAVIGRISSPGEVRTIGLSALFIVLLAYGANCALLASRAFTREREQKMLEALLLSPLSPFECWKGAFFSALLRPLSWCGLPLAGALRWNFIAAPSALLLWPVPLLGLGFCTVACGLWLSLLGQRPEIAALGTFAPPAVLLFVLPQLGSALSYILGNGPLFRALNLLLLAPLERLDSASFTAQFLGGLQLGLMFALLGALFVGLAVRGLRAGRDATHSESIWQRDLTRAVG